MIKATTGWFEVLDQVRRRQGEALDALGLGAEESTYRVVFSTTGVRLRHYSAGSATDTGSPALVIVPAPIKSPSVWDMAPEQSVVRRAQQAGLQVYMVEWTRPEAKDASLGLETYAGLLVDQCLDVVERAGASSLFLAGHSLGGTFAALYSAYRPQRLTGLVLIESPLHFAEASGAFNKLLQSGIAASAIAPAEGRIAGSLLNHISVAAAPATFIGERHLDYWASHGSVRSWRSHWRAVRWTLHELPLPRKLFDEVVEQLYRGDQFMKGQLCFAGTRLSPAAVQVPLLGVYDPRSTIIPPASVKTFFDAAGSAEKQLMTYSGDTGVALQHIGALIGSNAHRHLWPQIFAWLHSHNSARAAGE